MTSQSTNPPTHLLTQAVQAEKEACLPLCAALLPAADPVRGADGWSERRGQVRAVVAIQHAGQHQPGSAHWPGQQQHHRRNGDRHRCSILHGSAADDECVSFGIKHGEEAPSLLKCWDLYHKRKDGKEISYFEGRAERPLHMARCFYCSFALPLGGRGEYIVLILCVLSTSTRKDHGHGKWLSRLASWARTHARKLTRHAFYTSLWMRFLDDPRWHHEWHN